MLATLVAEVRVGTALDEGYPVFGGLALLNTEELLDPGLGLFALAFRCASWLRAERETMFAVLFDGDDALGGASSSAVLPEFVLFGGFAVLVFPGFAG